MADNPVKVEKNTESVTAQVMGKPQEPQTEVPVRETSVTVDEVILDPNSDLAVQIPEEAKVDDSLPIEGLVEGKTPEQQFSESGRSERSSSARKSDKSE